MKKPKISIVVAISDDRAIGSEGKLLWDIPDDRKRFRDITSGHPVILGRKTFESILSYIKKPLPNRTNIIVTRDPNYKYEGCIVCHSIEDALEQAQDKPGGDKEIFVGGGAEMYKQALPYVDRIYLTIIEGKYSEADTFFPEYSEFKKVLHEEKGESNGYKYRFLILER